MIRVKCVGKNRNDKGVIVNYNLVDEKGNKFQATSQQIKSEIKAGKYQFTNLQIDKAGRLVDKAEEKTVQVPLKQSPVQKTVREAPVVKELSPEEKKKAVRKEVNDYIKYMNENYSDDCFGAGKFLNDLHGEGNPKYLKSEQDLVLVCEMTDATRNYFRLMVEMIEKEAIKGGIEAYRYDEEFSVKLPESVEKFMQSSGCEKFMGEALYMEASRNDKLALIQCGIETMSEGFSGRMFLTGKYEEAKKFISECIKEEADNCDCSPAEVLIANYAVGVNMKGNVFVLKYLAEVQKHDAEYYKKQVIELAQTPDYMCDPRDMSENIRHILRNETCGLSYLAIKLGILPARDDWDTEEEKQREYKITAEAKRLAAELKK